MRSCYKMRLNSAISKIPAKTYLNSDSSLLVKNRNIWNKIDLASLFLA